MCLDKASILYNLLPREFKILSIIYTVQWEIMQKLLPKQERGSKDVVAVQKNSDGIVKLYIKCKRYKTTE